MKEGRYRRREEDRDREGERKRLFELLKERGEERESVSYRVRKEEIV